MEKPNFRLNWQCWLFGPNSTIMFIMFWDLSMVEQTFLHELPNNVRLRILGNEEISQKSQNFIELLPSPQSSPGNKNLLKNRYWTFPAVHYFTWKLELVSNILWMIEGTRFHLRQAILNVKRFSPKRVFPKWKKWTLPLNSAYSN